MWFRFTFADGYSEVCRGYSRNELKVMERKHGSLVAKEYDDTY